MGRRGPLPKSKALQILHGTAPLTAEVMDDLNEEFISPDMPGHFTKEEAAAWNKTIELLRPITKLKKIDVAVLGAYCSAFVRWQSAEKEIYKSNSPNGGLCIYGEGGTLKVHPLVTISRDAQRDMVFYAAQLGMTPASRIKMVSGPGKIIEKNPFVKLKALKK
jgi:P27 family predicted phage terminase small subunit